MASGSKARVRSWKARGCKSSSNSRRSRVGAATRAGPRARRARLRRPRPPGAAARAWRRAASRSCRPGVPTRSASIDSSRAARAVQLGRIGRIGRIGLGRARVCRQGDRSGARQEVDSERRSHGALEPDREDLEEGRGSGPRRATCAMRILGRAAGESRPPPGLLPGADRRRAARCSARVGDC